MVAEQVVIEQNPHQIVIDEPDTTKAIQLMDRMDLEQAMAELRGEVIGQFVYVVPGGRNRDAKQQLSYAGVKEAARLYKNVQCGARVQQQPGGDWVITAWAKNLADNFSCDEYPCVYPKFAIADKNAQIEFRATVSKTIRNALMVVLPISYLNTMIEKWLAQQGKPLAARAAAAPPRVPSSQPQREPATLPVAPERDPEIKALRLELAQWFERFPDAYATVKAGMDEAGITRLSDDGVRARVAALRKRAAKEDAEAAAAQQPAPPQEPEQLAVDMTKDERMAQTIPFARSLCERLRAAGTRPSPGEISTLRTYLAEIQRCEPLADDTPVERIADANMLAAVEERLAVADQPTPTPSADNLEDTPF